MSVLGCHQPKIPDHSHVLLSATTESYDHPKWYCYNAQVDYDGVDKLQRQERKCMKTHTANNSNNLYLILNWLVVGIFSSRQEPKILLPPLTCHRVLFLRTRFSVLPIYKMWDALWTQQLQDHTCLEHTSREYFYLHT